MRKENSFKMEENTNVQDKGGFYGDYLDAVSLLLV